MGGVGAAAANPSHSLINAGLLFSHTPSQVRCEFADLLTPTHFPTPLFPLEKNVFPASFLVSLSLPERRPPPGTVKMQLSLSAEGREARREE